MRHISIAVTLASVLALAAPAAAGSTDYLLKLGGVEGGGGSQIEVLSYSWGETRSADIDGNGQVDALTDGLLVMRNSNQPGNAGKVSKVDSIAVKQSGTAAAPRANDRLRNAGPKDGWPTSSAAESGSHSMLGASDRKELKTPASAGSLTVIVAPGHGLCTAGKSLGTLTLAGSGGRAYVLDGVTVHGCEAATAGGRPAESLSLNYSKVKVRGWNPEKKED